MRLHAFDSPLPPDGAFIFSTYRYFSPGDWLCLREEHRFLDACLGVSHVVYASLPDIPFMVSIQTKPAWIGRRRPPRSMPLSLARRCWHCAREIPSFCAHPSLPRLHEKNPSGRPCREWLFLQIAEGMLPLLNNEEWLRKV